MSFNLIIILIPFKGAILYTDIKTESCRWDCQDGESTQNTQYSLGRNCTQNYFSGIMFATNFIHNSIVHNGPNCRLGGFMLTLKIYFYNTMTEYILIEEKSLDN